MNLLAAAAVVSSLLAFATPHVGPPEQTASGCTGDASVEKVCLDPERAPVGRTVGVHGVNFTNCHGMVLIRVQGAYQDPLVTAEVTAGTFDTDFKVPGELAPGRSYDVEAVCDDNVDQARTELEVTATPAVTPTLRLEPASAAPSDSVRATGTGFDGCPNLSQVRFYLNGAPVGTAPIGGSGGFTTSIAVPSDLRSGTYPVIAECGAGSDGRARASADLKIVVPPPGPSVVPSPPLPYTPEPPPYTPDPSSNLDPPPYTSPVPPQPSGTPPRGASGDHGGDTRNDGDASWLTAVLAGLLALLLAVLAALLRRVIKPPPPPTPVVDAVLVGSGGPPPTLRETGADTTVALQVVGRVEPGTQTVRWREEGDPR